MRKTWRPWGYEDLQRQVSLALGQSGNALYDLVRRQSPDLNEAEFVDNVTRHLRRGEFLLLIIGDGIQEGAANIVDFVQRYSGLHFNLAMVEAALYRDAANSLIVQPRVLARTEIVQRFVVEGSLRYRKCAQRVDADEQSGYAFGTGRAELCGSGGRFLTRFRLLGYQQWKFRPPLRIRRSHVKVRNSGYGDWALVLSMDSSQRNSSRAHLVAILIG